MRSTKLLVEALGLCALFICVVALTAGAAQAAEWDVEGKALSNYSPALEPEEAGELENEEGALLTMISGLHVMVVCTYLAIEHLHFSIFGTTTTYTYRFLGCKAYKYELPSGPRQQLACTVNSAGQPNGTIVTEELYAQLELHEGSAVTLVIPANEEELFATVEFGECALPEEMPIYGVLAGQDAEGAAETEQVVHLLEEESELTKLYAINAKHPLTMDGSVEVFLIGAHTGETWSSLPE